MLTILTFEKLERTTVGTNLCSLNAVCISLIVTVRSLEHSQLRWTKKALVSSLLICLFVFLEKYLYNCENCQRYIIHHIKHWGLATGSFPVVLFDFSPNWLCFISAQAMEVLSAHFQSHHSCRDTSPFHSKTNQCLSKTIANNVSSSQCR